jgi:predicted Rossmann-fold nucleotide-binding protein
MRVLVCGGRSYSDRKYLYAILNDLAIQIDLIITGGANGADRLAAEWALDHSIDLVVYQARWKKWGRSAGHRRNHRMLMEGCPDLVIAFPGGPGTNNMMQQAKKAGVETRRA